MTVNELLVRTRELRNFHRGVECQMHDSLGAGDMQTVPVTQPIWRDVMRKLVYGFTLLLLLGLGLCTSAFADPVLDFTLGVTSVPGAIAFAGGANPLIGTQIPVASVLGLGTPLNNGTTVPLSGFFLNFTTGAFASSTANSWTFGPEGPSRSQMEPLC